MVKRKKGRDKGILPHRLRLVEPVPLTPIPPSFTREKKGTHLAFSLPPSIPPSLPPYLVVLQGWVRLLVVSVQDLDDVG